MNRKEKPHSHCLYHVPNKLVGKVIERQHEVHNVLDFSFLMERVWGIVDPKVYTNPQTISPDDLSLYLNSVSLHLSFWCIVFHR